LQLKTLSNDFWKIPLATWLATQRAGMWNVHVKKQFQKSKLKIYITILFGSPKTIRLKILLINEVNQFNVGAESGTAGCAAHLIFSWRAAAAGR
jgi:hypothetical protein